MRVVTSATNVSASAANICTGPSHHNCSIVCQHASLAMGPCATSVLGGAPAAAPRGGRLYRLKFVELGLGDAPQRLVEDLVGPGPLFSSLDRQFLRLVAELDVLLLRRVYVDVGLHAFGGDVPLLYVHAGRLGRGRQHGPRGNDAGAVVELVDVARPTLEEVQHRCHRRGVRHDDVVVPVRHGLLDVGLHPHDAALVAHLERFRPGLGTLAEELEPALWQKRVGHLDAELARHLHELVG
mmetsp:Transcript_98110/g.283026  ORF Transcript_98110/g.283026 Transcript_98110/m.283026 type:complete len:239 (+) Transcript_98110:97-813(+)